MIHVNHMLEISELPADCIAECSASGDVTGAVEHWRGHLGFTVDRANAIRCLKGYGAWDDLDEASDDTLAERVLWLACGDFAEYIRCANAADVDPYSRPEDFDPSSGSDIFCLE